MFHEHKNTKLNHFSPISKVANFWVLHYRSDSYSSRRPWALLWIYYFLELCRIYNYSATCNLLYQFLQEVPTLCGDHTRPSRTSDGASRGARGAPAPPTAAGPVEFLVLFF